MNLSALQSPNASVPTRFAAPAGVAAPPATPTRTTEVAPQGDVFRPVSSQSQADVEAAVKRVMNGQKAEGVQFADSKGHVKHLALMISEQYVQGEMRKQVLGAYDTLFKHMEPDTKFTVVAATEQDAKDVAETVAKSGMANPERVQVLEADLPSLTVWARDMMVPKFFPGDPSKTALIAQEPLHNWHLNDSQVPEKITSTNPSIVLDNEKAMITDGGDTQSNSNESFVGYYSLAATENKLHENLQSSPIKPEVIQWYQNKTGKTVVESDPKTTFPFRFEPVTAGDGTPITRMEKNPDYVKPQLADGQVSDAQMYDDLAVGVFESNLGKPVTIMGRDNPKTGHIEEPASDHMDMSLTPVDDNTFMVGSPRLADTILGKEPTRNRDNQADFDAYAKTLTDKGYKVIRMPHHEPAANGDPYITYNNCLMERFKREDGTEVKRVFLPQYNQPALDQAATQIWQKEGFQVVPMQLDHLSSSWGALRCISNWLDRSDNAA